MLKYLKSGISPHFYVQWEEQSALKKIGLERVVTKKYFALGGVWSLIGWVESIWKSGAWQERGEWKVDKACHPQTKYV